MNRLIILCIEDEREVLDALLRDLRPLEESFRIEATESVGEARQVVKRAADESDRVALVLADHVMPGETGVSFLIELSKVPATARTRKVLVTAQAGHHDTIRAVNEADLDHYISKPWERSDLLSVVKQQLVQFVLDEVEDVLPFVKVLDSPRLLEAIRKRSARID